MSHLDVVLRMAIQALDHLEVLLADDRLLVVAALGHHALVPFPGSAG